MLGIRKFNAVAIDLWVGPWQTFHCQGTIFLLPGQETSIFQNFFSQNLNNLRHIAIIPQPHSPETTLTEINAKAQMQALFKALQSAQLSTLKRITFILPDTQLYQFYQSALFETFPE